MQERTPLGARKRGRAERSTLWSRLMTALLLGGPTPSEHRARSYQPHADHSPAKAKAKARRRARNRVARRSRRVNRMRAR